MASCDALSNAIGPRLDAAGLPGATAPGRAQRPEAAAELAQADLGRVRKLGNRDLASDDAVERAEAEVKETCTSY